MTTKLPEKTVSKKTTAKKIEAVDREVKTKDVTGKTNITNTSDTEKLDAKTVSVQNATKKNDKVSKNEAKKPEITSTDISVNRKNKTFSIEEARQKIFAKYKDRFSNIHTVPNITHITLSACCSRFMSDGGKMSQIEQQIRNIACQQPIKTHARKSNASFKLRKGMHIGFLVTLRKKAALQFLFKLLYVNMPRIQDFQGLTSKSFDNNGNYNIGMKDINAFIETNHDLVTNIGMNISIATTSVRREDSLLLFRELQFPFVEFLK